MKIEEQVTSLELSKKLFDLGIKQESYFYWKQRKPFKDYELSTDVYKEHKYYSAFTVAELGEMLPVGVEIRKKWYSHTVSLKLLDTWYVYLSNPTLNKVAIEMKARNEVDARAKMLLYLIENSLMNRHAEQQPLQR